MIKCFDILSMVIDEATERFSPLWVLNNEKYDILNQYCTVIDKLAEEFDGESIDVEVNETNLQINISLECSDIIIENRNHIYFELIDKTLSFGFSVSQEGNLLINFTFASVWDKAF